MRYLFFLFVTTFCFSQSDFNQLDTKGLKHGLWKGFHEESKRQRYEGTFEHGKEIGTFTYFDDTKAKSVIATRTFSENGSVAQTIFFDQNKNIVSEGKTINRLNEGEWKYYKQASKDLMATENYAKGKLNGVRKVFYKNNIIAEETQYVNGIKEGAYKKYTEKGVVLEESFYKNGQYNGFTIFRDALGDIVSQGPFVDGVRKGKWQFFEKGKLKSEQVLPIVKKIGRAQRLPKK